MGNLIGPRVYAMAMGVGALVMRWCSHLRGWKL